MNESFHNFVKGNLDFVKTVQELMSQSLDDDIVRMDVQLREIESSLCRMKGLEADANLHLDVAEAEGLKKLPKRSTEYTDMERGRALAALVSEERRFRDLVTGIIDSIQTRVSYAQSRMRMIERNHG